MYRTGMRWSVFYSRAESVPPRLLPGERRGRYFCERKNLPIPATRQSRLAAFALHSPGRCGDGDRDEERFKEITPAARSNKEQLQEYRGGPYGWGERVARRAAVGRGRAGARITLGVAPGVICRRVRSRTRSARSGCPRSRPRLRRSDRDPLVTIAGNHSDHRRTSPARCRGSAPRPHVRLGTGTAC